MVIRIIVGLAGLLAIVQGLACQRGSRWDRAPCAGCSGLGVWLFGDRR